MQNDSLMAVNTSKLYKRTIGSVWDVGVSTKQETKYIQIVSREGKTFIYRNKDPFALQWHKKNK